jgi:hypothetical protein
MTTKKCCGLCGLTGHTIFKCDSDLANSLRTFAQSNPSRTQLIVTLNNLLAPAIKFVAFHFIQVAGKINDGTILFTESRIGRVYDGSATYSTDYLPWDTETNKPVFTLYTGTAFRKYQFYPRERLNSSQLRRFSLDLSFLNACSVSLATLARKNVITRNIARLILWFICELIGSPISPMDVDRRLDFLCYPSCEESKKRHRCTISK